MTDSPEQGKTSTIEISHLRVRAPRKRQTEWFQLLELKDKLLPLIVTKNFLLWFRETVDLQACYQLMSQHFKGIWGRKNN